MLGLYLYTLKIGHKSCKILSILKKNNSKGLAKFCDKKCVFGQKVKNTTTTSKKSNLKSLAGVGN